MCLPAVQHSSIVTLLVPLPMQLQAASCFGADGVVASGATTAVATTPPTMAAALQLRLHLLPHLAMILLRLLQLQLPLDMVCAAK